MEYLIPTWMVVLLCPKFIVCKTSPALVTVAMPDKQCRSHATQVLMQWKIHCRAKRKLKTHWQRRLLLIWNKVSGPSASWFILKEIQTINIVLWLFNMSWQITVLPQFKHLNRSSFHIYLKHFLRFRKGKKKVQGAQGIQWDIWRCSLGSGIQMNVEKRNPRHSPSKLFKKSLFYWLFHDRKLKDMRRTNPRVAAQNTFFWVSDVYSCSCCFISTAEHTLFQV